MVFLYVIGNKKFHFLVYAIDSNPWLRVRVLFQDHWALGTPVFQMKVGTQQMNKPVGGPGLASPGVDVHIRIQDENDNNPVFVPSEWPDTFDIERWSVAKHVEHILVTIFKQGNGTKI